VHYDGPFLIHDRIATGEFQGPNMAEMC
jgi:hypothetical protein